MRKQILAWLSVLFIVSGLADEQNGSRGLPLGCANTNISFSDNDIILGKGVSKDSHVYLLYNKSKTKFVLNHVERPGTAAAGWGSEIEPNHWSAIMLTEPNFNMTCTEYDGAFTKILNCADVLKACQLDPKYNGGFVEQGSYWITEDKPFRDLYPSIRARGLRTPQ